MCERAKVLAGARNVASREAVLGSTVEDLPIHEVHLDEDPEYVAMEQEWRALMKDPVKNARRIVDQEKAMRGRAKKVADAQKVADREAVLGKEVEGLSTQEVKLDEDPEYTAMEQEWRSLMKDPVKNARRIADQEKAMRERAKKVAEAQKIADREAVLGKDVGGVPVSEVHLDEDPEYTAMEQEWRALMDDPAKNAKLLADLESRMCERAKVLAGARNVASREAVLGSTVEGLPIQEVQLDEDPEYVAMESEWRALMKDPVKNAKKIAEQENAMRERAKQVVAGQKVVDREAVLGKDMEGFPIREVKLDEDPEYTAMESEWRDLMKDPVKKARAIEDHEKRMRRRAKKLADAQKAAERETMMGTDVDGVRITDLPLDEDEEYTAMEQEWRNLLKDPVKNARKIAERERAMRERVKKLAEAQKIASREAVLGKEVEGIPVYEVRLDEDPQYTAMEQEWRALMEDPVKNAKKIVDQERAMRERAKQIAAAQKVADREAVLGKDADGIPIHEVHLDEDPEYIAMEQEWRALMKDPVKNAKKIVAQEKAMRERAGKVAEAQKVAEREAVHGNEVEGLPIHEVHLDEDPEYTAMEQEWRSLMIDPVKNARKIADQEKAMRERAKKVAGAQKVADRESVLGNEVEGIPIHEVRLDEDPEYTALEQEWRALLKDPVKNARKIVEQEDAMRERAKELAAAQKIADREAVLGQEVEGMAIADLPLEEDPEYTALESKWRTLLKDPVKNAALIAECEKNMRARAKELSGSQTVADREAVLGKEIDGVPISHLPLDEDPEYFAMEQEWRDLMKDPVKNARKIVDQERAMRDRAKLVAGAQKVADREAVLGKDIDGVLIDDLPLDEDQEYTAIECEWRSLMKDPVKNARSIADQEKAMRERAKKLADAQKVADREAVLGKDVDGIPIHEVHLDEDPEYTAMEQEWRALMKDPVKNARKIADQEKAMRERAKEVADAQTLAGRETVLGRDVDGIPITDLRLDEDPEFSAVEQEWRALMKDPVKNVRKIAEQEKLMCERAKELANLQTLADREAVLGKDIGGIPTTDLPLDEDPEYCAMESEWRDLLKDPVKNAKLIEEQENAMRERAKELVHAQTLADREAVLGKDMDGMLVADLPLDEDPEYTAMECEWRALLKDPVKNAKAIAEQEKAMQERAKELMHAHTRSQRKTVLGKNVNGILITDLLLDDDLEYTAMECEWRALMRDPVKNREKIADQENAMRECAKKVADAQKVVDREAVLGKEVEGLPIYAVRLDEDEAYTAMECEWRALMKDPVKYAESIVDHEKAMRERAKELAAAQKIADREAVLGNDVEGIQIKLLPLDDDTEYAVIECQWRDLMKDPVANAAYIADQEKKMHERAKELALLQRVENREVLLGKDVEGIPVGFLGLDESPEFLALEVERYELLKNPEKNGRGIVDVERRMKQLASSLAFQRMTEYVNAVVPAVVYRVPRSALGVEEDAPFKELLAEYARAKREPGADTERALDLEEQLLHRAKERAQAQRVKDMPFLDKMPEGVPIAEMLIFEDITFGKMDEWRENLLRNPQKNKEELADVEKQMNDCVHALAKIQKMKGRRFLAPITSVGIPTADVPLNTDRVFLDLEKERNGLIDEDPIANANRIAEIEDMMNDRVDELARNMKWDRRGFIPDQLEGIPKNEIPVDSDPRFLKLEEEYVTLIEDPNRHGKRIQQLEVAMCERAHELAKAIKWNDRAFLDPLPEGVPLARLGIDQDPEFVRLERLRKELIDDDPEKNAHRIGNLEDALNERAHALAQALKAEERKFLDQFPEDVPLSCLGLDGDPRFKDYESERRVLREGPNTDARKVAELEDRMNAHVHNLAKQKKAETRAKILGAKVEGVPLDQVPLDGDDTFQKLEAECYRLMAEDSVKNAARISSLEDLLRKRAQELAKKLVAKDHLAARSGAASGLTSAEAAAQRAAAGREALAAARAALAKEEGAVARAALADELSRILRPTSYGMPLDLIPVAEDPEAMALLKKYRLEAVNPRKAADAEKTCEKLQDRVDQIGYNMIYGDRAAYLDPHPEGVHALDLPVHNDPVFREIVLQRALLQAEDPVSNVDAIKDLERDLNVRAHELAGKWNQRLSYLDPEPEGIAAMDVPVDDDEEFVNIEDHLNTLLASGVTHGDQIESLKEVLNDRYHELANGIKAYDLSYMKPEYNGVSTEALDLHGQEDFRDLANKHRRARREGRRPEFDADEILEEMERIAEEVAAQGPGACYPFLDAFPEGVPLEDLDLEGDARFRELEARYGDLINNPKTRNDPRVKEVQDMMNARVHELAQERQQQSDLAGLERSYLGVPTKDLRVLDDPTMSKLIEQYERALRDPATTPAQLRALKEAVDRRGEALAADYIARERATYLPQNPRGVPLDDLHVDKDPFFKEMDRTLRTLMRKDPSSGAVKDLKYKISEYVDDRSRDLLRRERERYLAPSPDGIPRDQLYDVLDNDPLFRDMEAERWRLLKDPRNATRVRG
ncbi:calpain-like cysteine peptidase, partial [Strigomonas culicis]